MAETIVSSFFWRSWGYFQKLQHHWGFNSKQFKDFVKNIQDCSLTVVQGQHPNLKISYSLLNWAIAYLTEIPDRKVGALVQEKLQSATPQVLRDYLETFVEFSCAIDNPNLFKDAERIFQDCPMKEVYQPDLEEERKEQEPKVRKIYQNILDSTYSSPQRNVPRNRDELQQERAVYSEQEKLCIKMISDYLRNEHLQGKSYEELQKIDENLLEKIKREAVPEIDFQMSPVSTQQLKKALSHSKNPSAQRTAFSVIHLTCSFFDNLYRSLIYLVFIGSKAFGIPVFEKPATLLDAQSQLTFYRSASADILWLGRRYIEFFKSQKNRLIVTGFSIVLLITFYKFYKKILHYFPVLFKNSNLFLKYRTPEEGDQSPFRTLTKEARDGLLEPSSGREEEIHTLIAFLSSPDSMVMQRNVILIGQPGVGKTRLIEEVALRIIKGKTACLNDKIIISYDIAAEKAKGLSDPRLAIDEIFQSIEGKESQHVLFIPHAHHFDENTLIYLVEKLQNKQLRVIFSTTPEKFRDSLAKVERLMSQSKLLSLPSLDPDSTLCILTKMVNQYNSTHPYTIHPDVPSSIIAKSQGTGKFEPQYSIQVLENLMGLLNSSTSVKPPLLTVLENLYDDLEKTYTINEKANVSYEFTLDGRKHLEKLQLLSQKIQQIQNNYLERIQLKQKAEEFLRNKMKFERRYFKLKNQYATSPKNPAQLRNKLYFWLSIIKTFHKQEEKRIHITLEQLNQPIDLSNLLREELLTKEAAVRFSQSIRDNIYPTINFHTVLRYFQMLEHQKVEQTRLQADQRDDKKERKPSVEGQSMFDTDIGQEQSPTSLVAEVTISVGTDP